MNHKKKIYNNFEKLLKQKDAVIEKLKKEVETISEISSTIVSGKYLDEVLNIIVRYTAKMMNLKICSIMLLDEEKQELVIKATQSLSEKYRNKPNVKVGKSISGKAVKERKAIAVRNVLKEKDYMYPEIARSEGLCSMLAVPMMIKNKVIGVINVYTSEEHIFTEDEIKTLQSIANQSAITIENTKLMEESLKLKQSLETRKLVEKAKGLLMQKYNMTEEQAFRTIQKKSMDSCKSMKEVAEAFILALGESKKNK